MPYFAKEFTKFFKDLATNNNTAWFDANRQTYENEVKKPFAAFVDAMIARIAKVEPDVKIQARDAIFRINKDIRFSKDKTPYNTHVGANISKYGRKDKAYPGFYFQLSHAGAQIFGGAYAPEKDTLQRIRELIAADEKHFAKLINAPAFKKHFGSIQGEALKRVPPEWQDAFQRQPLIANKQYYYQGSLPPAVVLDDKLPDRLMEYHAAGKDVNAFLRKAFA
jgi:uncharacterized protein (TIGR02453 family)